MAVNVALSGRRFRYWSSQSDLIKRLIDIWLRVTLLLQKLLLPAAHILVEPDESFIVSLFIFKFSLRVTHTHIVLLLLFLLLLFLLLNICVLLRLKLIMQLVYVLIFDSLALFLVLFLNFHVHTMAPSAKPPIFLLFQLADGELSLVDCFVYVDRLSVSLEFDLVLHI